MITRKDMEKLVSYMCMQQDEMRKEIIKVVLVGRLPLDIAQAMDSAITEIVRRCSHPIECKNCLEKLNQIEVELDPEIIEGKILN